MSKKESNVILASEHAKDSSEVENFQDFCSELSNDKQYKVLFPKRHRGKNVSEPCFSIVCKEEKWQLSTSYYVGVDWVDQKKDLAFQVFPKVNTEEKQVDVLGIVFNAMQHPGTLNEVGELFQIKWEDPEIEIEQTQDLITPLLIVEFLSILKEIVRKGLKKSYYRVEKNLNGRIKGKVQVGNTVKRNLLRNRTLYTSCSFEEYGVNNVENRLLKKAYVFAQRYLANYVVLEQLKGLQNMVRFISPALLTVSDEVSLHDMKNPKTNKFYKEYERGLTLAHFILKRFGYNIQQAENKSKKVLSPPHWIDMSKVFELHVLNLLRERFEHAVSYQFETNHQSLDYLINSEECKMVVDAKYKPKYNGVSISIEDARQVSGYARLNKVYQELKIDSNKLIDCLIIYPDLNNGFDSLKNVKLSQTHSTAYCGIYKLGVKLPLISASPSQTSGL